MERDSRFGVPTAIESGFFLVNLTSILNFTPEIQVRETTGPGGCATQRHTCSQKIRHGIYAVRIELGPFVSQKPVVYIHNFRLIGKLGHNADSLWEMLPKCVMRFLETSSLPFFTPMCTWCFEMNLLPEAACAKHSRASLCNPFVPLIPTTVPFSLCGQTKGGGGE